MFIFIKKFKRLKLSVSKLGKSITNLNFLSKILSQSLDKFNPTRFKSIPR